MILGIHVDKKKSTLHESIQYELDELGINACQIFTHNPRSGVQTNIEPDKIKKVTHDIDLYVHSSYVTVSIWNVNNKNKDEKKSINILQRFESELIASKKINANCYVVHISKKLPEEIVETMQIIKPIVKRNKVKIGLEMIASKSDNKTYETPEKINNLLYLLDQENKNDNKWYGIVVDTAHIWAAGIDITDYKQMDNWLNLIKKKNKILLFHVNGSFHDRCCGKDKHAIPLSSEDKIWHNTQYKKSGLYALVNFATKNTIAMILEVKLNDPNEVKKCINMIKT